MQQIWLKGKKIRLINTSPPTDPKVVDAKWGEGGYSRSRRSLQLLNVGHCVCGPTRTKPSQMEPVRSRPATAGRPQAKAKEEEEDKGEAQWHDCPVLQ